MTIRELRAAAERRPATTSESVGGLAEVLTYAATGDPYRNCAVCGGSTHGPPEFVIPVSYIAARLVEHRLEDAYPLLPLRRAALCDRHRDHFGALFVDVADPRWDLMRLEQRAAVLGGVVRGGLLVLGGTKALQVADEFHASVGALRRVASDDKKGRL